MPLVVPTHKWRVVDGRFLQVLSRGQEAVKYYEIHGQPPHPPPTTTQKNNYLSANVNSDEIGEMEKSWTKQYNFQHNWQ